MIGRLLCFFGLHHWGSMPTYQGFDYCGRGHCGMYRHQTLWWKLMDRSRLGKFSS